MHTIRHAAAVGALLAFTAGSAAAQQHGQGHGTEQKGMQGGMMQGGMMQGGMMQMMEQHMGGVGGIHAYQPAALLEHKEHLVLTAAQVTRLDALAKDTPAVDTGEMGKHHASLAHFTAAADARTLLTVEQRGKVEEMIGHGHGGGGGGPQHQN